MIATAANVDDVKTCLRGYLQGWLERDGHVTAMQLQALLAYDDMAPIVGQVLVALMREGKLIITTREDRDLAYDDIAPAARQALTELMREGKQAPQATSNKAWLVSYIDPDPACEETILGVFNDKTDADAIVWWFGARAYVRELSIDSPTTGCMDCLTAWQNWHAQHEVGWSAPFERWKTLRPFNPP